MSLPSCTTLLGLALLCLGLSGNAHASLGQRTAQQLQANYDATPDHCLNDGVPAHACSGVLLRSTLPSPAYHTWHHSPNSKAKGGVSFSYLRADLPTTRLAGDGRSGFILYPSLQRPSGTLRYTPLCILPTDGDTWERDRRGCGNNRQTDQTELMCHSDGVHTAQDWIARFRQTGDYKRQCAFELLYGSGPARAMAFQQSLKAQRLYADELPFPWNEVVIETWDEAQSAQLPVQAFFYIDYEPYALEQAQADQRDWHQTHGAFIPVVRLSLPLHAEARAKFSYSDADQAVPLP